MMKNKNMWPFFLICFLIGFFILFSFTGRTSGSTWPWHMGGGGFMMFPGFFILIFIIVMFFMMVSKNTGMCGMGHNHEDSKKTESNLSILKKRYAKGDINKKQYEDMKKEIQK